MDRNIRRNNARSVAAEIIRRVTEDDAYSQRALSGELQRSELDSRDRGFATHLAYGTLTYLSAIERILEGKLSKGLGSVEHSCAATLRTALFEMFFDLEPAPSAVIVNEAVRALPPNTPKGLRGLVNGVLRTITRSYDELTEDITDPEWHGLPTWLYDSLGLSVGPEQRRSIMAQWNLPSKTWIRSRIDSKDLERNFEMHEHSLEEHPVIPYAYAVRGNIRKLPGFNEDFVVQDPGAQLTGWLCSAEVQVQTIVDACAGLGGKTLLLHDQFPSANIHAIDKNQNKLSQIPNFKNLHTHSTDLSQENNDTALVDKADITLVDAPCSALGTIGRHPEIRWRRDEDSIHTCASTQRTLLEQAAKFVTPGGLLLYSVCTWTQEETDDIIDWFLQQHTDFELEPFSVLPNIEAISGTLRTWPSEYMPTDGFYYARLRRYTT